MTWLTHKLKFLIFSLLLFLLNSSVYAREAVTHYTIYIDVGSSGSRLYLYEYKNTNSLPDINEIFSKKTFPGLSSFEDHPENASNSVKELLESAHDLLKKKNNVNSQKIPVNILSTAGMRSLTPENQTKIYAAIEKLIKQNHTFAISKIQTISGEEEGLYGWLTVNYLSKNFQTKHPTLGSIEMGNASTQIAFATEEEKNQTHFASLNLNKKIYHVVSKSFLGFGLLEARKKIANKNSFTSCYPLGYPLDETHIGKFNFNRCSRLYAQLIADNHINTTLPYPQKMKFIAYSAIYNPLHFLEVDTDPSKKNITQALQTVCSKPWKVLAEKYSQKENQNYLPYYCADATYISNLFFKGYQLSDKTLQISKEINDHKIAWTLGALLYKLTNQNL